MAGDILQKLGWDVTCRGEIKVKGKGFMKTYFVDPDSMPHKPETEHSPDTSNNNNNNNKSRKSSHDMWGERRRSSQLSLSSLKGMLSSHRGSLEINSSKEVDTHSTRSLPVYKPIRSENLTSVHLEMEEFCSAGSSSRSSFDSKDSGVVKGSYRPSYPSPVAEEMEWTSGPGTPMQKDPSKPPDSTAPVPQLPEIRFSRKEANNTSESSSAFRKSSNSFPDISHMQAADSVDTGNYFTSKSSRKSQRSPSDKRRSESKQTDNRVPSWSSPSTTITIDTDQVESVRL